MCIRDSLYAGPLFIHQMSHLWLDFRGIHDDFNGKVGIDYFENSRRATYVQRQYGIENPLGFSHYHKYGWGLTASDGPGPVVLEIDGIRREFFDYTARGAPFGPDDGTISPWAVVASLPFAPEIVIDTVRHAIERLSLKQRSPYGFDASFNPTYPDKSRNQYGWVSPWIFGLNQGPIILIDVYKRQMQEQAAKAHAEAGDLPLYYTEWNISSNPRDPLHDGPFAAAFVTKIIMEAHGLVQGYSFWTFSDIFEENYFPSVPFHGGFGLLNLHGCLLYTSRCV